MGVGQLGDAPSVPGQQLNATITAQGRLQTPEEFRNIVLRTNPGGSALRLGDVARVELGSSNYGFITRYNGKPASGVAVNLATNANALDAARGVERMIRDLERSFPPGLKAVIPFDTTPFVRASIIEVVKTLLEAVVLVFLVMYLFLQNFRATLIPTIAVPVVLLGTFGILAALGQSINMLTMFAMVLAIGLLVDDAIVVVENVERLMREEHLSPLEATRKSMDQITGALVGIALVLAVVFVPMAFLGGAAGVIYRQFSITIVAAMGLSVLVAIVLTPALCATMLKPHDAELHEERRGFFGWFNRVFERGSSGYRRVVGGMLTAARPLHAGLRRPGGGDGLPLPAAAHRLPAQRGPGLPDGDGAGAGGRHPGAHAEVDLPAREALPREREGDGGVAVHRAGLQLRRLGAEHRHRLHQAQGLGGAQGRGGGRAGDRRPRHGVADADQGRHGVRLPAAADLRARHQQRLRLLPQGPARAGARRAHRARATSSSAWRRRTS